MMCFSCCSHAGDMCCCSVGVAVALVAARCCASFCLPAGVLRVFQRAFSPGGGVGGGDGDGAVAVAGESHMQHDMQHDSVISITGSKAARSGKVAQQQGGKVGR